MTPAELKAARTALGLTVPEMAAALGVTPQAIRRLEAPSAMRTVTPTMEMLVRAYLSGYPLPIDQAASCSG